MRRRKPEAAKPTHLATGVAYRDASTVGSDACFTLVQPVSVAAQGV